MAHYGLVSEKTQAGEGNENGDVEQSHYRFKDALDQALMLRGHREFESRPAYERFVREMLDQRNAPRREKLQEEKAVLGRLPPRRFKSFKRWTARVGQRPSTTARSPSPALRRTWSRRRPLLGRDRKDPSLRQGPGSPRARALSDLSR